MHSWKISRQNISCTLVLTKPDKGGDGGPDLYSQWVREVKLIGHPDKLLFRTVVYDQL